MEGHAQRAADQSEKQTAYVDDEKPGFRRCTATTGTLAGGQHDLACGRKATEGGDQMDMSD
jgi:hypothetical protein